MIPEELHELTHQQPFEPFRLVLTDGQTYDIRHPDLLFIGKRVVHVGLTGDPGQVFFERAVRVDLLHIVRTEPLPRTPTASSNGTS